MTLRLTLEERMRLFHRGLLGFQRAKPRRTAMDRYRAKPDLYRALSRRSMRAWRNRNPELARQRNREAQRAWRARQKEKQDCST
jgi:hypothetical protein